MTDTDFRVPSTDMPGPGAAGEDAPSPMAAREGDGQGGLGDQVQEGVEQAKEMVGQATEQLSQKAQELGGQAQQKLRDQVDSRSTQVGEQVSATAAAVRSVSQQLQEQGQDLPAQIIAQAAGKAEQVGQYLRTTCADQFLHDVEDFGRRQPWTVIAGGIALGFLGARFLKASSQSRYDQHISRTAPPTEFARPRLAEATRSDRGTTYRQPPGGMTSEAPGAMPATPTGSEPASASIPGGTGLHGDRGAA
jgi:hypothetical protein